MVTHAVSPKRARRRRLRPCRPRMLAAWRACGANSRPCAPQLALHRLTQPPPLPPSPRLQRVPALLVLVLLPHRLVQHLVPRQVSSLPPSAAGRTSTLPHAAGCAAPGPMAGLLAAAASYSRPDQPPLPHPFQVDPQRHRQRAEPLQLLLGPQLVVEPPLPSPALGLEPPLVGRQLGLGLGLGRLARHRRLGLRRLSVAQLSP
jgi:hypothetical protein